MRFRWIHGFSSFSFEYVLMICKQLALQRKLNGWWWMVIRGSAVLERCGQRGWEEVGEEVEVSERQSWSKSVVLRETTKRKSFQVRFLFYSIFHPPPTSGNRNRRCLSLPQKTTTNYVKPSSLHSSPAINYSIQTNYPSMNGGGRPVGPSIVVHLLQRNFYFHPFILITWWTHSTLLAMPIFGRHCTSSKRMFRAIHMAFVSFFLSIFDLWKANVMCECRRNYRMR